MPDHQFELPAASDGQVPVVHAWHAEGEARGAVVVAHGMGEHALRYEPLARTLARAGFAVYANDHRGHGQTAGDASRLGDYGPEGWRGLVDDQIRVVRKAREDLGVPVLLLGHSMGSMIVQHLLTEASDLVDGAALSGTSAVDVMAAAIRGAEGGDAGDRQEGDLFARFNAAFEPVRTESDWLSRDPHQVDLYVADPLCGFSVTDASMASLMEHGVEFSTTDATERIRKDLPIYLFAGDRDPVSGGGQLVTLVAERYRGAGVEDVRLKLYAGARHEVLNETNRDEVEADFRNWAVEVRDAGATRGGTS
jgi:alpha-beta hydrolase superfamily lysophospholipase